MHGTVYQRVSKIKGFSHAFKLKPTPKTDITLKRVRGDAKHALTVDDIRKVKHSNPTYQIIFITMAQTGLAIGDTISLNVEEF